MDRRECGESHEEGEKESGYGEHAKEGGGRKEYGEGKKHRDFNGHG